MPYEVPQPLRYEEKIVFGLNAFQSGVVALALIAIGMIWIRKPFPEWMGQTIIVLIALLAVAVAFFNAANWFFVLLQYFTDQKKVMQPSLLETFLFPIDRIADETIYLLDGGMRAVLRVEPIHFQSLHDSEKKAIIAAYRAFLNSLEFPIQLLILTRPIQTPLLFSKTVPGAEKSIQANYWKNFTSFMEQYLDENEVVDRQFYLIIPYSKKIEAPIASGRKMGINLAKKDDLRGLGVRARLLVEKLSSMGLSSSRLNDRELSQLLINSFDGGLNP